MEKINVLSLFDGISAAQIALNRSNIKYNNYFASEIDKYAIKVTQANYPNTIQLGDIKSIDLSKLPKMDLLCGGSPCKSFSISNINRQSFESSDGKLFYDYVRIKNQVNPKYFLYENVASMKQSDCDFISQALNIKPYKINSNNFSVQTRLRYYWTNIPIQELPINNQTIIDIISNDEMPTFNNAIFDKQDINSKINKPYRIGYINNLNRGNRIYSSYGKSVTLTASSGGIGRNCGLYLINNQVRRLSPIECERLQTINDNFTNHISDNQRYKCLGNSWTVDVIVHIFKNMEF